MLKARVSIDIVIKGTEDDHSDRIHQSSQIQALMETVKDYPQLAQAQLLSFAISSGVAEQPLTLQATIQGAKNRAKNAYVACNSCSYSFGIESGLFQAPGTNTGFLEACACCIYDGENYHIGLSCGFEVPPNILSLVLETNIDLNTACHQSGITNNTKLGAGQGLIGLLSKNRIDRKEYTKQSIITTLIQIENDIWYTKHTTLQIPQNRRLTA